MDFKNFKDTLYYTALKLSGKYSHIKKTAHCKTQWYGTTYGGAIACPTFINKNSIVYSFGIGEDVTLDLDIIKHHGCNVYGFDPTPKSIQWVQKQKLPANFIFLPYGLGSTTGMVDFYLPKNPDHVSGSLVVQKNVSELEKVSVQLKNIKDVTIELGHSKIDVLKIDIEGAEYDVIDSILQSGVQIDQMLIEIHERFFEDGKQKTIDLIKKMNASGYEIFATSISYVELAFIRIALIK